MGKRYNSGGREGFWCECGRFQPYAPIGRRGGITAHEAEQIGWRKIDGKWVCPFCCGNTDVLRTIFDRCDPA